MVGESNLRDRILPPWWLGPRTMKQIHDSFRPIICSQFKEPSIYPKLDYEKFLLSILNSFTIYKIKTFYHAIEVVFVFLCVTRYANIWGPLKQDDHNKFMEKIISLALESLQVWGVRKESIGILIIMNCHTLCLFRFMYPLSLYPLTPSTYLEEDEFFFKI